MAGSSVSVPLSIYLSLSLSMWVSLCPPMIYLSATLTLSLSLSRSAFISCSPACLLNVCLYFWSNWLWNGRGLGWLGEGGGSLLPKQVGEKIIVTGKAREKRLEYFCFGVSKGTRGGFGKRRSYFHHKTKPSSGAAAPAPPICSPPSPTQRFSLPPASSSPPPPPPPPPRPIPLPLPHPPTAAGSEPAMETACRRPLAWALSRLRLPRGPPASPPVPAATRPLLGRRVAQGPCARPALLALQPSPLQPLALPRPS